MRWESAQRKGSPTWAVCQQIKRRRPQFLAVSIHLGVERLFDLFMGLTADELALTLPSPRETWQANVERGQPPGEGFLGRTARRGMDEWRVRLGERERLPPSLKLWRTGPPSLRSYGATNPPSSRLWREKSGAALGARASKVRESEGITHMRRGKDEPCETT